MGGHSQNIWRNVPEAPKEHIVHLRSARRPIECRLLGIR